MGSILELQCTECGYSGRFLLGQGMADSKPERISSYFDGPAAEEVLRLQKDPETAGYMEFQRGLGQCKSCGRLMEVPVLRDMRLGGRNILGRCICGGSVRLWIQDDHEPLQQDELPVCPDCGAAMSATYAGMWD